MILGATLSHEAGFPHQYKVTFMFFPLVVHCLDIISSTIGMFFVRTSPGLPGYDAVYDVLEDPTTVMKRAYRVAMLIGMIGFFIICHQLLNPPKYPDAWIIFGFCGLVGLGVAFLFIEVT